MDFNSARIEKANNEQEVSNPNWTLKTETCQFHNKVDVINLIRKMAGGDINSLEGRRYWIKD